MSVKLTNVSVERSLDGVRIGVCSVLQDQLRGNVSYCLSGTRRIVGTSLIRALFVERWNPSCDGKRKPYKCTYTKGESIDACEGGGSSSSSDEALVMRVERRG